MIELLERQVCYVVTSHCLLKVFSDIKEPRSPMCLFLFGSCFLNEKWLFEKEDVNHLQIASGQEYID